MTLVLHATNVFPFIVVALVVLGLRRTRRIPRVAVEPASRN